MITPFTRDIVSGVSMKRKLNENRARNPFHSMNEGEMGWEIHVYPSS